MALLMSSVVASSAIFASPIREGCLNCAMDLSTTSRNSSGMEAVSGSTYFCPGTPGRDTRSVRVKYETSLSSNSTLGESSEKFGRIGCATLSSKLTNDLNQSTSSKTRFSRRSRRFYCAMVTDVGNVEVDKVSETEDEVRSDASRKPRVKSTSLMKAGRTDLISVQDYLAQAPQFINSDSGPPRWFCATDAEGYPSDAPTFLFVPGMDSIGLGLLLHQKELARLFEVQCLHVPLKDRTPFVGLVEIVEQRIREEYERKPGPIYLMGESFGGSIVLSVASRNPDLDLVLVLVNPATSFASSRLQPLIPLLQIIPDELFRLAPYLLSFTLGDPVRMASASVDRNLPPWQRLPKLADAMTALLPTLPTLADIMPKEVLRWKVELLKDGALYANSHLRGIKSDILLLVSGKDQVLPSVEEAKRLKKLLPQIKARYFPNSGHTLLLEEGLDVASMIKMTQLLRHKKNSKFDPVKDFRPPFPDEVAAVSNATTRVTRQLFSPIFLSMTENRSVRRGLPQLPVGQPLLFVSNHTLIGFDLGFVVEEFLQQKGILLRGLAHPKLSEEQNDLAEPGGADLFRLFGTVPVTGSNLYKLLARGEAALLYPGGVREALKRKGELYKLFWSETAEFVRTAIRHGATIVPFASVGGDDIIEIVFDSNELLSLPFIGDSIRQSSSQIVRARTSGKGEVRKEEFVTPVGYFKSPPRMYFLFKQPISTEGMLDSINDREATSKLYNKVKEDVESGLEYLLENRKADPYKDFLPRALYEVANNNNQAPTFDF